MKSGKSMISDIPFQRQDCRIFHTHCFSNIGIFFFNFVCYIAPVNKNIFSNEGWVVDILRNSKFSQVHINHIWQCFCRNGETDLQFKKNSQGNLKQDSFCIYSCYYVLTTTMCDKTYYSMYLRKIKWFMCAYRRLPLLLVHKQKGKLLAMYATRQFHLYTYVVFIVYEISLPQIIATTYELCHTILQEH